MSPPIIPDINAIAAKGTSLLPSIPSPTPDNTPTVISLLVQLVNRMSGANGKGSKAITLNDLVSAGIANYSGSGDITVAPTALETNAITFARSLHGVTVVDTLPALPNPLYPIGAWVVLVTDGKLYRNANDVVWTKALDGADLIAQSVAAQAILDGSITQQQIADAAIVAAKLANSAVTSPAIALGAVLSDNLAAHAVTYNKLASGAVDATKFATGQAPIAVGATLPTPLGYSGPLTFFNTTDAKLYRYDSVLGQWTKAVDGADIVANSIVAGAIAAGAITATAIAAGAVTTTALAAGAVTASVIAAGAIGTTELAAASITADKLAASSITAGAMSVGAITANALAVGAVDAAAIAVGAITAEKLAAGAVTAQSITAKAITAAALNVGSVTTAAIAAGAITAAKLNVTDLSAVSANLGTITAGLLKSAGDNVVLDLAASKLTIMDSQVTPVKRVEIGALGNGDYGVRIWDRAAKQLWSESDGPLDPEGIPLIYRSFVSVANPVFMAAFLGWTKSISNGGWSAQTGSNSPLSFLTTYAEHAGSTITSSNSGGIATESLNSNSLTPVHAGTVLKLNVHIKAAAADGYAAVRLTWLDLNQVKIGNDDGNPIAGTTIGVSKVSASAPTNAVFVRADLFVSSHTVGYYYFTSVMSFNLPSNIGEIPDGGGFGKSDIAYLTGSKPWKLWRPVGLVDISADDLSKHSEVTQHIGGLGVSTVDFLGKVTGRTADRITYTNGDTVDSLRPGQPGADVTATNVSADSLSLGSTSAAVVLQRIAAAAAAAAAAETNLVKIGSDRILSAVEKPAVLRDYNLIIAEQSGIDAQAASFLGVASTEQVAYDSAIANLTTYLSTLTTPVMWNDVNGETTLT